MSSLIAMLKTGITGLRGLTKAALDLEPVCEQDLLRRRRLCAACPAATRTKHLGRVDLNILTPMSQCSACQCNLHAKTRVAGETCPWGKW